MEEEDEFCTSLKVFPSLRSVRLTLPFSEVKCCKNPNKSPLFLLLRTSFQYPCVCPEECPWVCLLNFPEVQTLLENRTLESRPFLAAVSGSADSHAWGNGSAEASGSPGVTDRTVLGSEACLPHAICCSHTVSFGLPLSSSVP